MSNNIEEQVKSIISDQLDIPSDDIKLDASFIDDLGADSLDIVELVMAMEDAFSMDIPDEEAEKIQTVRNAIDYIKAQSAA
jgi:acyl carrier protein